MRRRLLGARTARKETTVHVRIGRLALALLLAVPTSVGAQGAPAGVVTTLQGRVVVARAAAPAPVPLQFKDSVFVRDRIETRQDSIVRVLLGGKVLVTVRELSVFTVTEEPGRARIDLAEGKAAVGVAKSLLRPGEVIEIRTPNAVAAVRGSEIVAEVAVVGGVPQSTITALDVSLPVTVTPLGAPGAGVTLGVNQAVSVLGLAAALTVSPVRTLTPVQVQAVARTAQAPKPREQSDKPPDRVTQKVTAERTQEAVQLSEAVTGGDTSAVTGRAVSGALPAELDAAEQTYRRTQEVLDLTSQRLDEIAEATLALINRAFEAERLLPGFTIGAQTLSLGPTDGLVFSGTEQFAFNPIAGIVSGAQVTQTGAADFMAVAPGADIGFEGSALFVVNGSLLATDGNVFSVGPGATFSSGFGGNGFVSVGCGVEPPTPACGSMVVAGGSIVAIGAGARATFGRPLLLVDPTSAVVVGRDPAVPTHVVDIGPNADVRLEQTLELLAVTGRLTATGRVLSLGEGASLTISTEAGGLTSLDLFGAIAVGRELVALEPRARLTTTQPLAASFGATVTVGTGNAGPADFIAVGREAELTTSGTNLILVGRGFADAPSTVTIGGSMLSLGERARVVSTSELSTPFIGIGDATVTVGGDVVAVGPGASVQLGPTSLLKTIANTALHVGGSLLGLDTGAVVTLTESLDTPVLFLVQSLVSTGRDMIALGPDAAMVFSRPLLETLGSSLTGQRGLLALGAGARLVVPDLSTIALLYFGNFFFDNGESVSGHVSLAADAVRLGAAARLELNRPLFQTADTLTFETAGGMLTLGPNASLISGGPSAQFALIEFAGGPARIAGPAVTVESGARLVLDRPLLGSFGSDLTMPAGALRVRPGGQVSATAIPEFFVGLGGGTHAIGTAPGASVFDLAGMTTGLDPESQLTLGTDRPVQYPGSLLIAARATLATSSVARFDTALLEATAPILLLRRSTATASADVLDLTLRAKLSGVGPLASLDGSTLSVLAGAFANVAGGSFLKVIGDLLELRNGSTLNLLNGPLLSVSGGSAVSISGALVAFGGSGGNTVNIANALCPCTLLGGVPVALRDGASASNVSIGGNAIGNPGLGTVSLSSPSAAAIVVSGPASRVTVGGR